MGKVLSDGNFTYAAGQCSVNVKTIDPPPSVSLRLNSFLFNATAQIDIQCQKTKGDLKYYHVTYLDAYVMANINLKGDNNGSVSGSLRNFDFNILRSYDPPVSSFLITLIETALAAAKLVIIG